MQVCEGRWSARGEGRGEDGWRLWRPEALCPARRMLVNAREWRNIVTWSGVAYTTSGFKARSNARWRGRSLAFKTRWWMCFSGFRTSRSPSFVFMKTFSLFLFFDRQNTYSCKSDLFANFSAVYIFPCTLNGDIPEFLLQLAVADDVGHLILFECASLSWAFLLLHFLLFYFFHSAFPLGFFLKSCFGLRVMITHK